MGYYVHIVGADVLIPNEHLQAAYEAVCELNNHNELKRGGAYPRGEVKEGPNPDNWFPWMDWNYNETCSNLEEVLSQVGYEVFEEDRGLLIYGYDNKAGAEDIFLNALAPYVRSQHGDDVIPEILWQGEDGERWIHRFINGKMFVVEMILTEGKTLPFIPIQ